MPESSSNLELAAWFTAPPHVSFLQQIASVTFNAISRLYGPEEAARTEAARSRVMEALIQDILALLDTPMESLGERLLQRLTDTIMDMLPPPTNSTRKEVMRTVEGAVKKLIAPNPARPVAERPVS